MTTYQPLIYAVSDWSRLEWLSFQDCHPAIKNILLVGEARVASFSSFAIEIFARLYSQPQRFPEDEIMPESIWAVKAHDQLEQFVCEFDALTTDCSGDSFYSGLVATAFLDVVVQRMPVPPVRIVDVPALRQKIQAFWDLYGITDPQQEDQLPPDVQQQLAELRQQGKEAVQAAIAWVDQWDETQLRNMLREGCAKGAEVLVVLKRQDTLTGFAKNSGLSSMSAPQSGGSLREKMGYSRLFANSSKLQQIAQNAGRLKLRAARKQRAKTPQSVREIIGITTGNDLPLVLPQEIAYLGTPALQGEFARRFVDQNLAQYELGGKETEVQGPVYALIDSSGSTEGLVEVWIKAASLALLSIAVEQKRHCRMVHFEGYVRRTDDFPPGGDNIPLLLEAMEIFFNGDNTNWQAPLDDCIQHMQEIPAFKQADIVLFTDGLCRVDEDWLMDYQAHKQRLGFTVWAVLIGSSRVNDSLRAIADKVVVLPNLDDDAEVDEIFAI